MKLKLLLISILIIESELIELNCPSDLESNIDFYGNDIALGNKFFCYFVNYLIHNLRIYLYI
jgi:hypothetical protein